MSIENFPNDPELREMFFRANVGVAITATYPGNNNSIVLEGSAPANSTVSISAKANVLGTATASASGFWSYTAAGPFYGPYYFTAAVSGAGTSQRITVDFNQQVLVGGSQRQITNRTFFPFFVDNTAGKASMTRSFHRLADTVLPGAILRLRFADWFVAAAVATNDGVETACGGSITRQCWLEVAPNGAGNPITPDQFNAVTAANPGGTVVQGTLIDGVTTTSVTSAGGTVDMYVVAPRLMYRGEWIAIWHRQLGSVNAAYVGSTARNLTGESWTGGTTGVPTTPGAITQAVGYYVPPVSIMGLCHYPAIGLLGDSIMFGIVDAPDQSGDTGIAARTIGALNWPYINGGIPSDRGAWYINSHTKREEVFTTANLSGRINNYGTNDRRNGGSNVAQIVTINTTIATYGASKPQVLCSMSPETTGAWTLADGSDQTAVSTMPTVRDPYNVNIRANFGTMGYQALSDVTLVVNNPANLDKWQAPSYTADGLHHQQLASLRVQASGIIPTALFNQ